MKPIEVKKLLAIAEALAPTVPAIAAEFLAAAAAGDGQSPQARIELLHACAQILTDLS